MSGLRGGRERPAPRSSHFSSKAQLSSEAAGGTEGSCFSRIAGAGRSGRGTRPERLTLICCARESSHGRNVMAEVVFVVPVLPGQEALDRQTLDEMADSRRDEYEALLKEA